MPDYGYIDPQQLSSFSDERRLRDLAVRLALAGYTLPESLRLLERQHQVASDLLEADVAAQRLEVADKLTSEQRLISSIEEKLAEKRELDSRKRELQTEFRKLQNRREVLQSAIYRKRRYGQAAAIGQAATRRATQARQDPIERLEAELGARQKVYAIEKQCWEINQPELERRRKLLDDEMTRVEGELDERKGRVAKLKELSITKTISGFLIWAGYLGFAATGSAISYILAKRLPPNGQTPWDSVNAVIESLRPLGGGQRPLLGLVFPLGFLLFLLFLIAGLIWVCDAMLKRFDSRWLRGQRSKDSRSRNRKREDFADGGAARSPITQFFQVPLIERSAFVQLLAMLPYIFVAGVLFVLFSGAGISAQSQQVVSHPSTSLIPNYIGAVYALLATAAALLYVIYISLPRAKKWPTGEDVSRPLGPKALILQHWELALLTVMLLFALAFSAFAPSGDLWERSSWGTIAVAMTLAAMGLAHGLVYHGLFRDLDRVERQRDRLKIAAEALDLRPMIKLSDFLDSSMIGEELAAKWNEEEDFRTVVDLYSTIFAFSDDPTQLQDFTSRWLRMIQKDNKKSKSFGKELLAFLAQSAGTSGPDYEYAPEEALEKSQTERSLGDLAAEIGQIESKLTPIVNLDQEIERHKSEIKGLETKQRSLDVDYKGKKAKLSDQHYQEELVFRSAFATGERVAPVFNTPGVSAGEPRQPDLGTN